MKTLQLIFITALFISCKTYVREEIEKTSPFWYSPDGKALIFQSHYWKNGKAHISLATFVKRDFAEGGGGFFDIEADHLDTMNVKWISDSTAIISYPKSAIIERQDSVSYFYGRNTYFKYASEE